MIILYYSFIYISLHPLNPIVDLGGGDKSNCVYTVNYQNRTTKNSKINFVQKKRHRGEESCSTATSRRQICTVSMRHCPTSAKKLPREDWAKTGLAHSTGVLTVNNHDNFQNTLLSILIHCNSISTFY